MKALQGKRIILGVCGGIAAYKSGLLVRALIRAGADVSVVMTAAAARFVTPLTFATLSGKPCLTDDDMFRADASVSHVEAGRSADLIVVAPATANTLAKLAHGFADNVLSAVLMASTCPVLLVPSMHVGMWTNPIVQDNVRRLPLDRYRVMAPEVGELASGDHGPGRFPEIADIVEEISFVLSPQDLVGRTIVVTAGPTAEPLDAVRVLTNPSSGRMGVELVRAAWRRGADVRLVLGPVAGEGCRLPADGRVRVTRVKTASDMLVATREALTGADALLMAAAVADERPCTPSERKLHKDELPRQLVLEPTPDILTTLRPELAGKVVLAFAAETDDLLASGAAKLSRKGVDMLFANPVGQGRGFGTADNEGVLLDQEGNIEEAPRQPKEDLAEWLLDRIATRLAACRGR